MPAENTKLKYTILSPKRKDEIKADPRWSNLTSVMHATWQQIGSDVLACSEEMGERTTNVDAIETVLDANYMSTNEGQAGKDAEAYVEELDKLYGPVAVQKFLAKEVRLN